MQIKTEADIPDQAGRLAIVTGGTGGLGLEVTRMLAEAGARVVLVGRNPEKGAAAIRQLAALQLRGKLAFECIDLADLASIAAGAARILASYGQLDLLINNAGVMAPRQRQTTADGFELQFGTNHLAPFALTGRLLPLLRQTPGARVVTVSSLASRFGTMDFADLQRERRYKPMAVYGQSKLANQLFSHRLQQLSDERGWGLLAATAHPGWARTDLVSNGRGASTGMVGAMEALVTPLVSISAADGALPIVCAALGNDIGPDAYIGPGRRFELRNPPGKAHRQNKGRNDVDAAQLWRVSEELTGVTYPEA
jgi:NAD(P)-dependent dehydrogenase (short-subunit alcohol dehydrogenase family)